MRVGHQHTVGELELQIMKACRAATRHTLRGHTGVRHEAVNAHAPHQSSECFRRDVFYYINQDDNAHTNLKYI